jgi:uncharacterized protein DUF6884
MIGLVSCSSQKLDRAAPARELYCSALFKLSLRYAQRYCEHVYVISAKHGLLDLDAVIEPYDSMLAAMKVDARREWGIDVVTDIESRHEKPELLVLAGEVYAAAIRWGVCHPELRAADRPKWLTPVREPLAGLMIGERLQWLSQMVKEAA